MIYVLRMAKKGFFNYEKYLPRSDLRVPEVRAADPQVRAVQRAGTPVLAR